MSEQQWKLVPAEPTEEMVSVFSEMLEAVDDGCSSSGKDLLRKFIATIAAAPQPPALGGEPEVVAEVVNKYGEPAPFAQRDLLRRTDIDKLKIGTELVDRAHVARLQAEVKRLKEAKVLVEIAASSVIDAKVSVERERDSLKARSAELEGLLRELTQSKYWGSQYPQVKESLSDRIDAALAEGAKS